MNDINKIVIIGCGAGGSTAAQFAKKTDRKSEITVFEKEKYPQYSKCGLPYVISKKISHYDELIEFSEEWYNKNHIDLNLETIVNKIDYKNKTIYAENNTKKIVKEYDSLIVATGSKSIIPPIKNIKIGYKLVDGIFVLRTIDNAMKIENYIKKNTKAVVIGAGLIGLEMADSLYKRGMKVSIVESLPYIIPKLFDKDFSKSIENNISKYIDIYTGYSANEVESKNGKISKLLLTNKSKERIIDTDIIIIATGTKPFLSNLNNNELKIGNTGGIIVNNKCETSMKNIYAVGDCTEYKDFITQKPINVGLGSIVVRQGISAGINSAGGTYELPSGFLQTCTSQFFGSEIASVGPSIGNLNEFNTLSSKFNGMSLPDYFPGGKPISLKITIDTISKKILSAQAIGENSAQRINTIACAILNNMDIEFFRKLETAYAPPIAPTLDVITLLCDKIIMKLNRNKK